MASIDTDDKLSTQVGDIAGAGLPVSTTVDQEIKDTELLGTTAGTVSVEAPTVDTKLASMDNLSVGIPQKPDPSVGQIGAIDTVADDVQALGPATAAQFTPTGDYITAPQGQVSAGSIATAATEELDQRGTVQFQLGQIMASLEEGKPMPPWASPQVRKINAIMQARGLGASSMASSAITQALMESGVQIAAADANKYSAIQLQNLNNRQQTALQNAATYAAMDRANLSARLQAAVTNAQAFLSIDMKNLDNQQKSNSLTYQGLLGGLLQDSKQENARLQFNAKNELQVEEFFAELGSQIETATANRVASMEQFNVSEQNSMAQYNTTLQDARDKFNATASFAIEQSNAVWRREVNTLNTANQNENNRIDVQNEYNATQQALSYLWQMYRDNASWNFQKNENLLNREHDLGVIALNFANSQQMYTKQQKDDLSKSAGQWFTRFFDKLVFGDD